MTQPNTRTLARCVSPCVAALLLLCGCSSSPRPNLLVIVIDTLRADRVGWYGGNRQLTPFLDSVAERGVVFWNAYAQSSWTNPSVAALLTSRYQSQHGVLFIDSVLPDAERTLPEVLREGGYATLGATANPQLTMERGFARGFDAYKIFGEFSGAAKWINGRAQQVNAACLAWLDAVRKERPGAPVFVYLQYMEPHFPYAPHQQALDRVMHRAFTPEEAAERFRVLWTHPELWHDPDPETLRFIQALYDAAVTDLDDQLRTLFSALEERGFLADSIVVITADHGEEFRDHGGMDHGTTLYNELIHVPLMVRLPERTSRLDVREVVSLVDVAPTLLGLAGMRFPGEIAGHSLDAALHPERLGWRIQHAFRNLFAGQPSLPAAYSELIVSTRDRSPHHERAVVVGTHKLIAGGQPEFFNLEADPGEQDPTALTEAEKSALQHTMEEIRAHAAHSASRSERKALNEETRQRLRDLGYGD